MENITIVKIRESKSMEETNNILKGENLPTYEDSITLAFRDRKKVFFEINFGALKCHTQQPYFSTCANELNRNRSGFSRCGQAQKELLENPHLVAFYEKWDVYHLENLSMEQYNELVKDVNELKNKVPFIDNTRFSSIVEFDRLFK